MQWIGRGAFRGDQFGQRHQPDIAEQETRLFQRAAVHVLAQPPHQGIHVEMQVEMAQVADAFELGAHFHACRNE
ncbi:hypothetical protein D3C87_1920250 [compost metagenome]